MRMLGNEHYVHMDIGSLRATIAGTGLNTPFIFTEGAIGFLLKRFTETFFPRSNAQFHPINEQCDGYQGNAIMPRGVSASRALCRYSVKAPYISKDLPDVTPRPAPSGSAMKLFRQAAFNALETPPNILSLARHKIQCRQSDEPSVREQGVAIIDHIIDFSCENEIRKGNESPAAKQMFIRKAAAEIQAELAERHGNYEDCEEVLVRLWDRHGFIDALQGEPWELANAWYLRAAVANHRGDVGTSFSALKRVTEALDREKSLRALVLRLQAATLAAVAAQNRWPFTSDRNTLFEANEVLKEIIGRMQTDILKHLGCSQDPVLGAALGTWGRSLAFLGKHDAAEEALFRARQCFTGTKDLRQNAIYLALVTLDRPTLNTANNKLFCQAFEDIIMVKDRTPDYAISQLNSNDKEFGFRRVFELMSAFHLN
jgi:hypothetical protein